MSRRLRILSIDDEPSVGWAVQDYFEGLGHQVDWADDVGKALELLELYRYDAVLVDLQLSLGTTEEGLFLVDAAKRMSPRACIVVVTGSEPHADTEATARRLGARDVLYKPQPLESLARVLEDAE